MDEPSRDTEAWAEWAAENKGPRIMAICWASTAFGCLFACGRLYVRGFMQRRLRSDDYLILATGALSCALTAQATRHGFGRHLGALSAAEQTRSIIWTLAAFCPGVLSFGFPKLAVVALLTRLLLPGAGHRRFLWAVGLLAQLVLVATVGVLVGRCRPVAYLWDKSLEGTCLDVDIQVAYCLFAGAFSAFVDLYLAAYPSVMLWQLQMPRRYRGQFSDRARMPTAVARRRHRARADLEMTAVAAPAVDAGAGDSQVDMLAKSGEDDGDDWSRRRAVVLTAERPVIGT